MSSRLPCVAAIGAALCVAGVIRAQQPLHPLVRGVVVDSVNDPVSGVEVSAADSAHIVVATVRSDKNGAFSLRSLAPNTSYVFTARHVGFAQGVSHPIALRAIDTLNLHFTLDATAATLPSVSVTTKINPAYRIDTDEIARYPVVDALDVVLNYRPRMLGDAYKECRPDTSHLTFRAPRTSALLPRLASPGDTIGQLPPRLYVNGILHQELGMKNILSEIQAGDIAEMHYIDCWDTSVPFMMRNALFVVLKPGKDY
jgi:hypothetical protein